MSKYIAAVETVINLSLDLKSKKTEASEIRKAASEAAAEVIGERPVNLLEAVKNGIRAAVAEEVSPVVAAAIYSAKATEHGLKPATVRQYQRFTQGSLERIAADTLTLERVAEMSFDDFQRMLAKPETAIRAACKDAVDTFVKGISDVPTLEAFLAKLEALIAESVQGETSKDRGNPAAESEKVAKKTAARKRAPAKKAA